MLLLFEEQQDKWYFRPAALAREARRLDELLQDRVAACVRKAWSKGSKDNVAGGLRNGAAKIVQRGHEAVRDAFFAWLRNFYNGKRGHQEACRGRHHNNDGLA